MATRLAEGAVDSSAADVAGMIGPASLLLLGNSSVSSQSSAEREDLVSGGEEGAVAIPGRERRDHGWTGPEKWQVVIGLLSLIVAFAALVGQFVL
jgi:hypothetical protein